jgi:signal transduction histidine kinase
MRERATLLRGSFEIHSAPLKGTEVMAQLPLEDRHAS